jgi:hypothetical protein
MNKNKYCFVVNDIPYFGESILDVFLQVYEVKFEVTDSRIVFSTRPVRPLYSGASNTFVECPVSYTREYTVDEAIHDMAERSYHRFGSMFKNIDYR